jgi:hypothetical protein
MDFDLTALRACFIPIMELEREFETLDSKTSTDTKIEDFQVAIMNTLVLELMRMVLST